MSLPKSAHDSALPRVQTPATVEVIDKQIIEDRGLRTTTDIAKAAVGVTGGDSPGAPAIFSMRGFAGDQINTLYNDIKIGPATMTGRPMDTANLDRVEILKGPASLLSGIGATGGAINYVTKVPHTGPIVNEAFARFQFVQGLPRRIWLRRQHAGRRAGLSLRRQPFEQRRLHRRYLFETQQCVGPAQLPCHRQLSKSGARLNTSKTRTSSIGARRWCRPMRPESFRPMASSRDCGLSTIRTVRFAGHVGPLNPVTIDARTLRTNYNVLDNHSGANELWLRSGFQWDITNNVRSRARFTRYDAHRHWFNNEINSFNDSPTPSLGAQGEIYRERLVGRS